MNHKNQNAFDWAAEGGTRGSEAGEKQTALIGVRLVFRRRRFHALGPASRAGQSNASSSFRDLRDLRGSSQAKSHAVMRISERSGQAWSPEQE